MGFSYYTCVSLVTSSFACIVIFYLVTLTLNFDLLLKNFDLGCYLMMVTSPGESRCLLTTLITVSYLAKILLVVRRCVMTETQGHSFRVKVTDNLYIFFLFSHGGFTWRFVFGPHFSSSLFAQPFWPIWLSYRQVWKKLLTVKKKKN